ncbi:MAG: NAD(P)-dependent oxidoreductase [Candidatus Omnitrophica bacterium]|nr:NAD(P)-dependent oxidoreductase [Candidatus Omnitrophota bacterium]
MEKAVVFGGSGFIGSHVADNLADRGYKVSVFDKQKSPYLSGAKEFVQGDILNKKEVEKTVKGSDIIYNFAGEADIDNALVSPLDTITTNIIGNTNILEACRKHSVKRFVFASTVYVYSNSGSFYRSSKQACELIIEDYHKHYGFDFTILRYGTLYGPRADRRNWLYSALKDAIEKKCITRKGDGEEIREYVHVYDAANLSVEILKEKYKNQYVMITGNQQIRIKDLMKMVQEILGKSVKLKFMKSDQEQHYEITPYNFSPKLAKKIVGDHYIDLGQGVLDLINLLYVNLNHKGERDIKKSNL